MSEPIFPAPGGGVATMAAPAPAEPQPEKASNRKALLAVAGVVGALVVGAGAFFMLTSGAPEEDFTIPIAKPSASASVAPSASAGTSTTVKKTNVTSRDPFKVLFPEPAAEPSAAATSGSTTDGTATTPPNQSQTTTYTVAVSDIKPAKGQATIVVDGKSYTALVGEKFAPYFTLYAVFNAECVGVLFGDQNVPVCLTSPATVTQ